MNRSVDETTRVVDETNTATDETTRTVNEKNGAAVETNRVVDEKLVVVWRWWAPGVLALSSAILAVISSKRLTLG